jgi:hypothetical protein
MSSGYIGISVAPEARDALRTFQAVAGGQLSQRITLTDALLLAVRVATAHLSTDAVPTARDLGILAREDTE